MLSLRDNPAPKHPADLELTAFPGRWWVAHTKARNEKALARDLTERGIPYYLPLIGKTIRSGRRKLKSLLPAFPGYLFFADGDTDFRYVVMTTNRVAHTIEVRDQARLVHELLQIERAVTKGDFDPHPFVREGRRVVVRHGPFRGIEGIVVRRGRRARLVLQVDLLGQAIAAEIDADCVEPAD
jgi:transcription antitermination factor NusG